MARRVKCQDTGEYTTSDLAYKAENKRYYSSRAAYEQIVSNRIVKNACIDAYKLATDWKDYWSEPTEFYKQLSKWANAYGYDAVSWAIQKKYDDIRMAMGTKTFSSNYALQRYTDAIIANYLQQHCETLDVIAKKELHSKQIVNSNEEDISLICTTRHSNDLSSLMGELTVYESGDNLTTN